MIKYVFRRPTLNISQWVTHLLRGNGAFPSLTGTQIRTFSVRYCMCLVRMDVHLCEVPYVHYFVDLGYNTAYKANGVFLPNSGEVRHYFWNDGNSIDTSCPTDTV